MILLSLFSSSTSHDILQGIIGTSYWNLHNKDLYFSKDIIESQKFATNECLFILLGQKRDLKLYFACGTTINFKQIGNFIKQVQMNNVC